jgi:hypothetical protein
MQIELLPYDGFLKCLNNLLPHTHCIEGTTAFWTLDEEFEQKFLWGNLIGAKSKKQFIFS